jgi:fatty acid synthase subunit alpha
MNLVPALDVGHSGALSKHTSGLLSPMVGGNMSEGFDITSIKGHLSKTWGLGPLRSDGVLLLGTTMSPAKRLGSEAEAKGWLDTVAMAYAQRSGISLSVGGWWRRVSRCNDQQRGTPQVPG